MEDIKESLYVLVLVEMMKKYIALIIDIMFVIMMKQVSVVEIYLNQQLVLDVVNAGNIYFISLILNLNHHRKDRKSKQDLKGNIHVNL